MDMNCPDCGGAPRGLVRAWVVLGPDSLEPAGYEPEGAFWACGDCEGPLPRELEDELNEARLLRNAVREDLIWADPSRWEVVP